MIYSIAELSEKIGYSISVLRPLLDRAEFTKYRTGSDTRLKYDFDKTAFKTLRELIDMKLKRYKRAGK